MTHVVPSPRADAGRDVVLLAAQLDALSEVLAGTALSDVLTSLLRVVETVSEDGVLGSVLLLGADGKRLVHCAAPSLPATYNNAISGTEIGPAAGSCGTAAYRREQVIVTDIGTDPLWDDFRDLAHAAGLHACWSTPIIGTDGGVLGTFAMYYPRPQHPTSGDFALINVLVRTVAMAIERSRADKEREAQLATERAAALTLQHSLLPQVPPSIGPVRLDARYRTGDPGVEVGGDWFDAVAVQEGLVVVVGDVQGHDLEAAALMGQLRTVVRASAGEGHPPASILSRAASYLARLDAERIVTALVVHVDTSARVATVASAGHLPPLLLSPGGDGHWSAVDVDVAVGPPLGIGTGWPERSAAVPAGGVLMLYTDGLVETRSWPLDEGLSRLRSAVSDLATDRPLGDVLDAALSVIPAGRRGDDVAVLLAAMPAEDAGPTRTSSRWLPAQPMSAPLARSWAEGLLAAWSVDPTFAADAVLVVSELVTNAVGNTEEALRVGLSFGDTGDDLLIEVFDRSHRLPYLRDGGPGETAGRGLHIVRRVAAQWDVRDELDGKTVWARLVRAAAAG